MEEKLKMAILDMNNGRPNQGMRCIRDITTMYSSAFDIDEFDVRSKNEIPDLSYDVYISSGGQAIRWKVMAFGIKLGTI